MFNVDEEGFEIVQKDIKEQLQDILDENALLKNEVKILNQSIVMLKEELKRHNIKTFDYSPLEKRPQEMSKEELKLANDRVTSRMKPKANSSERLPMATPDQEAEMAQSSAQDIANNPGFKMLLDVLIPKEDIEKKS